MGCDIHMWMEFRRPGQPWRLIMQTVCGRCDGSGRRMERVKREDDNYDEAEVDCWFCDGRGFSKLMKEYDEERRRNKEHWNTDGRCYQGGRDYSMFGALAGVRSGQPNLIDPRGVPDDASQVYKELVDQEGSDGHSHSWLNLDDIIAIMLFEHGGQRDVSRLDEEPFDDVISDQHRMYSFHETFQLMQRIADKLGPTNVRIVFFFDN